MAEHPDPGRRLDAMAAAYVAFGLAHPYAYEAMFMLRNHPLTREAEALKHVQGRRLVDTLTRVVRESGRVAPGLAVDIVVQALRCALHGVVSLNLLHRPLLDVHWETLVSHLVTGVVQEGPH